MTFVGPRPTAEASKVANLPVGGNATCGASMRAALRVDVEYIRRLQGTRKGKTT